MDYVEFFLANFLILGSLGCQGWDGMPKNVKKFENRCTQVFMDLSFAKLKQTVLPPLNLYPDSLTACDRYNTIFFLQFSNIFSSGMGPSHIYCPLEDLCYLR
jgi:hypothetical protein